jgi:glycosyltransferase involved in cell wall biosynthesis
MALRILHVFGRLQFGGAEKRTVAILPHLPPGVVCDFVVLSGLEGDLDDEVRAAGGEVYRCALGPSFPIAFIRLLRRVRPDVLHSHVHWVSGSLLTLARLARVPGRIAHFRSTGDGKPRSPQRRARDKLLRTMTMANATGILAVGEGVLDAVIGERWRDDPRCAPLYSGINLTRFGSDNGARTALRKSLGIPKNARIVAHVGNMRGAKNHRGLAHIFAQVTGPNAPHLMLIGRTDPATEADIRVTLATADSEKRLHILGVRDDVPTLLKGADAFLFPSVYEGLPGSVLEALAAGLPVVASDLPGVREIAERVPGVDVLSLDVGPEIWATTIGRALERGPLPAGLLHDGPFDATRSAAGHVDAWKRALSRR